MIMREVLTVALSILGYIYYVFPTMHAIFNPITFWQKLVMLFTIDLLSIMMTLMIVAIIFEGLNKIHEVLTN